MNKNIRRTLAALGIAAVAASAAPMFPALRGQADGAAGERGSLLPLRQAAGVPSSSAAQALDQYDELVVDLQDNVSAADIRDLERRTGLDLEFNSVNARDDKLMIASVLRGSAEARALDILRQDARVEAAEPQEIFTIPGAGATMPAAVMAQQAVVLRVTSAQRALTEDERLATLEAARVSARAAMEAERQQGIHFQTMLPQEASCEPDEAINSVSIQYESTAPSGEHNFRVDSTGRWVFTRDAARSLNTYSLSLNSDAPGIQKPGTGTRPNDPRYDEQWNFKMVDAEDAWKRTRGKGVVVAVIDTGVAARSTGRGKQAQDFNITNFTEGYDFVHNDKDPYDDHGHGTHVAGTIAESTNNNQGVAGLAYEATIMPIKVLTAQGWGTSSDIADAIRFAADKGANVINMSLGSNQPSDVIRKACQYAHKKGVVIVCAAGNGFGEPVGYPAAFPECIAVSSVGPSGKIATYSSYGKQVALAAPGGDMMESGNPSDGILQNTVFPESQGGRGDDYYAFQGTSMASPHVAAVAALVVSQGIKDPARVREVLTKTAVPNGDKNKYGAGILSAAGATRQAAAETGMKLRHLLFVGMGLLLLSVGGASRRRSLPLRAAMALALGFGFFAPDWFAGFVGADSAWNLIGFSALVPLAAYALLKNGPGVKVAGALALGYAVNLFANWHNGTLPFTTWTFGQTAAPWTAANMTAAFVLAHIAAWRAARNMR